MSRRRFLRRVVLVGSIVAMVGVLGVALAWLTLPWIAGDRGTPGSASWCLSPGQQPIVIDEVMFDPEVPASERNSEWFEVTNLGTVPVDLAGWTIVGGDMKTHTIAALTVAPGRPQRVGGQR